MILFLVLFLAVAGSVLLIRWLSRWVLHANDIELESMMKPCPKCGHKAITVYYTGENYPPFFTAECGAYMRRDEWGHINGSIAPEHYFDGEKPMTDAQKECSYCAGYGAEVPQFMTRRGAIEWWNNVACKE